MRLQSSLILVLGLMLVACASPAPFNTATISKTPANAKNFAKAKQASKICSRFPDVEAVFSGFEKLGYKRTVSGYTLRNGEDHRKEVIFFKDDAFQINATRGGCTISLVNMTPQQSAALAKPWADKFAAKTNAELGQGLSDRVVQVWRSDTEQRYVLVTAYKTWPNNFQPFGEVSGSIVTLGYSDRREKQ